MIRTIGPRALLALLLGCISPLARAGELFVPAGYPTVQAAIDAALPGDRVIVADGVYSGPGNSAIQLRGKLLEVRSENGQTNCVLDGGATNSVFTLVEHQPDGTTIRGFTIRNGYAPRGGGAYVGFGAVLFEDCIFENNAADEGGGTYVARDETDVVRFHRCTFRNNSATRYGGGIRGDSPTLIVESCLIEQNVAIGDEWNQGVGGGLHLTTLFGAEPGATIVKCDIEQNFARQGGGVSLRDSGLHHIRRCHIRGNLATYFGGGVLIGERLGLTTSAAFVIEDCEISGNRADWNGGGLAVNPAYPVQYIRCTTIAGNTAAWYGGGLLISNTAPGTHNTVWTNSSILSANRGQFGADLALDNAAIAVMNHADLYGSNWLWVSSDSFVVWDSPNLNADPRFVDSDGPDDDPNTFDDNDFRLDAGSPCIDAGDPGTAPSADFLDAAGHVRPWDADHDGIARVDMGAYEFGSSCPGDLDTDGAIGLADLSILLSRFGQSAIPNDGDIDGDGQVTLDDLAFVLAAFGSECGT